MRATRAGRTGKQLIGIDVVRHFLTLMDLSPVELNGLIQRAIDLKREFMAGHVYEPMRNKTLAMIFEKSSTRTRVSFEAGFTQFGGNSIFLSPKDSQFGRGEPTEDTARVLSGMVDIVVIRTGAHDMVDTFATYSSIPVINGLTDSFHPCQLLADIQTYTEHRGTIRGRKVAWIGDGNNMCHSWMNAARQFDFNLHIAVPKSYAPDPGLLAQNRSHVELGDDPLSAAKDAHVVVTDTWVNMGQEQERKSRIAAFEGFCVDRAVLRQATTDAVFMHCLPAYRGFEVEADVIDGPQSVVWEQAANRLHAQKALVEFLMDVPRTEFEQID